MVLWTVMPIEAIFPSDNNPIYEDIEFSGTKMSVEKVSTDEYRVVRILSTDPQDFLRKDLQPGQIISRSLFSIN